MSVVLQLKVLVRLQLARNEVLMAETTLVVRENQGNIAHSQCHMTRIDKVHAPILSPRYTAVLEGSPLG